MAGDGGARQAAAGPPGGVSGGPAAFSTRMSGPSLAPSDAPAGAPNRPVIAPDELSSLAQAYVEHWPVAYFVMGELPPKTTSAELEALVNKAEALFVKILVYPDPHAIVIDVSNAARLPMRLARRISAMLKKHRDAVRDHLICTSIVTRTRLFRLILKTVFTIVPPQRPYRVVCTLAEANAFVTSHCEGRAGEEDFDDGFSDLADVTDDEAADVLAELVNNNSEAAPDTNPAAAASTLV